MSSPSKPWTVQELTDYANSLGLQSSKLDTGQVKIHLPSSSTGLFFVRLESRYPEYLAELVVS